MMFCRNCTYDIYVDEDYNTSPPTRVFKDEFTGTENCPDAPEDSDGKHDVCSTNQFDIAQCEYSERQAIALETMVKLLKGEPTEDDDREGVAAMIEALLKNGAVVVEEQGPAPVQDPRLEA